jgi:serine/threonine protein phosphatase PrpC
MQLKVDVFHLPKEGSTDEEYEDAYWPPGPVADEFASYNLAVADGATETSFSGLWASLLVKAFGESKFKGVTIAEDVLPIQAEWKQQLGEKNLPWYAEEKLRSGAFAALAGLQLQADGTWSAVAVGDSCIFHVRDEKIVVSFPIERSEQFNDRPVLISSNRASTAEVEQHVRRADGKWQTGDIFYLMTDAIACYFLRRWEEREGDPCVPTLFDGVGDRQTFGQLIRQERTEVLPDGRTLLRNDDVTVIRCSMVG